MVNHKKKKIFEDSIFLTVAEVIAKLRGILFIPIIIKTVGVDNYGVFVQIITNRIILAALFSLALGMGFFRFTSQYEKIERNKINQDFWSIFSIVFLLSLIGSAMLFFLSPVISKYILKGLEVRSVQISSLLVISGALWRIVSRFIQARKKFKLFSVLDLAYKLLPYFSFSGGILWTGELVTGILFFVLSEIVIVLLALLFAEVKINYFNISPAIIKQFVSFSWPLTLTRVSNNFLSQLDHYFIGFFIGPSAIGIYHVIYTVLSLLIIFTVPIGKYFEVYTPKLWDKGSETTVLKQLRTGILLYIMLAICFLSIASLYIEPVLNIFIKNKMLLTYYAWPLTILIGFGTINWGITKLYSQVLKLKKNNQYRLYVQVIAVVINALLNYLLIPVLGLTGAAWSTFISYLFINIILILNIPIGINRKYGGSILILLMSVVPMFILDYLINPTNTLTILILIFIDIIIYFFLVFFFKVFNFFSVKRMLIT